MSEHLVIEVSRLNGAFHLMVRHPSGNLAPAGMRLQREMPLPVTQFQFTAVEDALSAAAKLQNYLDAQAKQGRK